MHAIGNLGKATDGPAAIDPYRPLILGLAPRRAAASALAEIGPAALAAVAALEALLEDDDFDVQQAAEEALAAIQGRSH